MTFSDLASSLTAEQYRRIAILGDRYRAWLEARKLLGLHLPTREEVARLRRRTAFPPP
jgi:hypothetical protein